MNHVAVREFGLIFSQSSHPGGEESLDCGIVPVATFQVLRAGALKRQESDDVDFLRLMSRDGRECIQVLNFVGVFQVDERCQLEILPKTTFGEEDAGAARALLWRMLRVVNKLSPLEADRAILSTLRDSWVEAMIRLVLQEISQLVRRGLRREYVRRQEEAAFLKGQLRVAAQVRQRPGREHYFHVSYDQFLRGRAENRLLKSCLLRLNQWTGQFENKRLCRELLFIIDDVPESSHVREDLRRWSTERGMIHYQPLLPWIRLILADEAPAFARGDTRGISLLFPMEQLFEEYVSAMLRRQLGAGFLLKTQSASRHLIEEHRQRPLFQLRPDLAILQNGKFISILDTKWKLIDGSKTASGEKYDLKQSDFYQLFAYGQKYLGGKGHMFLIYPAHTRFRAPLPRFIYQDGLHLWIVPFDLETGGLVGGEWCDFCEWYAKSAKLPRALWVVERI